jgi:hypothetical protein
VNVQAASSREKGWTCGILVIGSLLWDHNNGRPEWRDQRLDFAGSVRAGAPIFYGRKSRTRGDTYTMCVGGDRPLGHAICLPCKARICTPSDLHSEALSLWKAEAPNSNNTIGAKWGHVAAIFRGDEVERAMGDCWDSMFNGDVVVEHGIEKSAARLRIDWPTSVSGEPLEFDIILATVTAPDQPEPTNDMVVGAWCAQNDMHERYFFENVRNGIRTADDLKLWSKLEKKKPKWIENKVYADVTKLMREEMQTADFERAS